MRHLNTLLLMSELLRRTLLASGISLDNPNHLLIVICVVCLRLLPLSKQTGGYSPVSAIPVAAAKVCKVSAAAGSVFPRKKDKMRAFASTIDIAKLQLYRVPIRDTESRDNWLSAQGA